MKDLRTKLTVPALLAAGSAALIWASITKRAPMSLTEVFGFISGAVCVWLVVKENIWNWPIGIINALFYIYVFGEAKLFADASLQVVYVILNILGWYWWLKGGEKKTKLTVSHTKKQTMLRLLAVAVMVDVAMVALLRRLGDSAPFLDSTTTTMSLVAQYMLTKKLLENWYVWIAADIIYIGLYFSRELYLTSVLYAIFMAMCVAGLVEWRRTLHVDKPTATLAPEAVM
jgi:nicotinamide mononucleotide transporter